jgi:epoxyqueuosine reductase
MVKAERCLTFHSESRKPLPGWIDKKWTNAIIGCMRCQSICPANREVLSRIETWDTFSMEETESFAAARSAEEIPPRVASKLESLGLGGYIDVMGRNLGLLLNRR